MNRAVWRWSPSLALALAVAAGPTAALSERIHRRDFYRDGQYGDIALVTSATSQANAADLLFVNRLVGGSCVNVPNQQLWFLLNHRDPEDAGAWRFFGVQIQSLPQTPQQRAKTLRLARNSGWADANGAALRSYAFTGFGDSFDSFLATHSAAEDAAAVSSRTVMEGRTGRWHAKLSMAPIASWTFRRQFSAQDADGKPMAGGYLAEYLLSFQATKELSSKSPLLFNVDPRTAGAKRYQLTWFSSVEGQGLQRLEFRTDGSCAN